MSHPRLRKFGLVAVGLALSLALIAAVERLAHMHTPGFFLASKLLPEGPDASIALFGYLAIGIDFGLCFCVLAGVYLLLRSSDKEGK